MIKMLVAQSDTEFRTHVTEFLRSAGYQVLQTDNGEAVLELYEKERPQLILLDMFLAGYSGIEILKDIRIFDKETIIVMLTDIQDESMQITAYEQLADDYIEKPCSFQILLRKLHALLRRSGVLKSGMLMYDKLELDIEGYKAYWERVDLGLTATEFELIRILVQNRGRVQTRMRLLDKIRGYDYSEDERIVDAHIKNLRRKLPAEVITTVKGIGYTIQ